MKLWNALTGNARNTQASALREPGAPGSGTSQVETPRDGVATANYRELRFDGPWVRDVAKALAAPPQPFSLKRRAAGCIVRMPNGKICVVEPRNHYGAWHTFPKGEADYGERLTDAAVREVLEETGLQVKLKRFVLDQERRTSMTRYFIADSVGGSADAFRPDETQATLQVPLRALPFYLDQAQDHAVLWHILNSAELSATLMPDASVRDASGQTGRDKLCTALLRGQDFFTPVPSLTAPHEAEDAFLRPSLRRLREDEPLALRAPVRLALDTGTCKTTCIEVPFLYTLLSSVTARSVVIFDVDLTLTASFVRPRTPWRYETKTVEPRTAALVRGLQDAGVPILGLTARSPNEALHVLRSLDHVGIDLSRTAPLSPDTKLGAEHPSLYRQGVIFASDYNSKGSLLACVHEATPFTHAIMVDDNPSNFFSLIRAARRRKFDLTCAYYSAALSRKHVHFQRDAWALVTKLSADPSADRLLKHHAQAHHHRMVQRREAKHASQATQQSHESPKKSSPSSRLTRRFRPTSRRD